MKTSLKTGFAQIFSCFPKHLSCPKFGGGCSPPRPPGPYAYEFAYDLQLNKYLRGLLHVAVSEKPEWLVKKNQEPIKFDGLLEKRMIMPLNFRKYEFSVSFCLYLFMNILKTLQKSYFEMRYCGKKDTRQL